jgi:hypothetical protein
VIVPLCPGCSSRFNIYGYAILREIDPKILKNNLIKFKLMHWFSTPSFLDIYRDSKVFLAWGKKQMKYLKGKED